MTTKEKFENQINKINNKRDRDIEKYQRSEIKKLIGYLLMVAAISIIGFIVVGIVMFHIWNYFNPTQDYLYFIAIYCIFGSICNMFILAFAEDKFKKHVSRKRKTMRSRERQINRYYNYMKDEVAQSYVVANYEDDIEVVELDEEM